MSEALVVGSINMDLVMRAERFPLPGETLAGGRFSVVPGGKGANQAAAARRMGHPTALIGAVGDDDFGTAALDNLRRQGVDASPIRRLSGTATGVAMIIVDKEGENTIVVASGANQGLSSADLSAHADRFRQAAVVALQCEIPTPTVVAALAMGRAAGARTVLNAAPAVPELPDEALQVDFLVVNEQEAEWLSGTHPSDVASAIAVAQALRRRGPTCAVVTLGALGCAYSASSGSGYIPAPTVPVVDTTAAGDAFIGGLMAAIIEDMPLEQALQYANCAGALAVTRLGAQTSLPDRASVVALLRRSGRGRDV